MSLVLPDRLRGMGQGWRHMRASITGLTRPTRDLFPRARAAAAGCRLGHDQAAVDVDGLPGDVAGVLGGEEGHERADFRRGSGALHRNALDPFLHQLARPVVTEHLAPDPIVVVPHLGMDDAGADRVHRDALGHLRRADPATTGMSSYASTVSSRHRAEQP